MQLLTRELGLPAAYHGGLELSQLECKWLAQGGIAQSLIDDTSEFTAPMAGRAIESVVNDEAKDSLQLRRTHAAPVVGKLASYFEQAPADDTAEALSRMLLDCNIPVLTKSQEYRLEFGMSALSDIVKVAKRIEYAVLLPGLAR